MSYHGLIVYFKSERFARLEISTYVINAIITEKKSNFFNTGKGGEGSGYTPNFDFVRIFHKFLGCLVVSWTTLN